ncbi:hypothetical protein AURDEDRAFT_161352 [Auricularia subglabra TFB-10046 SS5]|nr:hypothetical protein AURDEDRAFT_161352 [Auricularia subglabra TFB-10046 SS5]
MAPGQSTAPGYSGSGQPTVPGAQTSSAKARKAEREAKSAALKEKASELVKNFRGDLSSLAAELDVPEQQVLQAGHVAFAKQSRGRTRSLYHAAIAVARREDPSAEWSAVLERASAINKRLQRVQERGDLDDPQLLECQEVQAHLQDRAGRESVPKSHSKTQRAIQQEVTRTTDEIASKLTTLNAAYGTEHVFAVTRGNHESSLSTQLVTSGKADDFFSFRMDKQLEDIVADMEGYAVWGAEAAKNGKGRAMDFRGQISQTFGKQLAELTGNKKIRIQWKNMDAFCEKHGIELTGWPSSIPFKKMANINRSDAKIVWALVKDKKCRFQHKNTSNGSQDVHQPVAASPEAARRDTSVNRAAHSRASVAPISGPSSLARPSPPHVPSHLVPYGVLSYPVFDSSNHTPFIPSHETSGAFAENVSDVFNVQGRA